MTCLLDCSTRLVQFLNVGDELARVKGLHLLYAQSTDVKSYAKLIENCPSPYFPYYPKRSLSWHLMVDRFSALHRKIFPGLSAKSFCPRGPLKSTFLYILRTSHTLTTAMPFFIAVCGINDDDPQTYDNHESRHRTVNVKVCVLELPASL